MKWPFRETPESSEDHPTTKLVERLLDEAVAARATDLHFEPRRDGSGELRLRIDGRFVSAAELDAREHPRVIARLKVLAGLPAFRTAEPMDGRLRHGEAESSRELRLSTLPVVGGEKAVVRVLGSPDRPDRLRDLGLSEAVERALRSLLDLPPGLLVVSGPCSSGKTTTLHALAREILERDGEHRMVASVEDPVEQDVEGMSQCEVDEARGLGFASALRSLLRQDPDVLLVGETRDPETAAMAVEAAFTGHLVLTSLHVGSPAEIPRRLRLLGIEDYLIAESLRGAVNQRLLRRTCGDCRGEGCEACSGVGSHGRFAIAEVVSYQDGRARPLTPSLDELGAEAVETGRVSSLELRRVLPSDGRSA